MENPRRLIVSETAGEELQRLLRLLITPVGQAQPARYGTLRGCWMEAATDDQAAFGRRMAAAIAGHIIRHWVIACAESIVRHRHHSLTPNERTLVIRHAAARMRSSLPKVAGLIAEYLESESVMIVEGFATFRVPGLRNDVEDAVDEGVDSVLSNREYRDFLRIVAGVVRGQSPRMGDVHVLVDGQGRFRLVDSDQKTLSIPGLPGQEWTPAGASERQDVLISALVALAPRRILLHEVSVGRRCPGMSLASACRRELLRLVFGDHLICCGGCELCGQTKDVPH